MKLVIRGRPATKKNSSRVVRNGRFIRVLPSKAFVEYERMALKQIGMLGQKTVTGPVIVQCRYWLRDRRWWPDLVGLLQATSDILQSAGIIEDDKNIVSYADSKIMGLDKVNPRVEIEIIEALWEINEVQG